MDEPADSDVLTWASGGAVILAWLLLTALVDAAMLVALTEFQPRLWDDDVFDHLFCAWYGGTLFATLPGLVFALRGIGRWTWPVVETHDLGKLSPEVDAVTRAGYEFICVAVVMAWLVATAILDMVALCAWVGGFAELPRILERPFSSSLADIFGCVLFPILLMSYLLTLLVTSPLIERVLQSLREAMTSITPTSDVDLSGLSPGLRGLLADARNLRVALETRDEATLREVWSWQRRFEDLGESDRRELEHHGLANPGIEDLLNWIVASPRRTRRGLTMICQTLEQFERRLLDPDSLFRGPFR